ncbi:MAG: iron-containing alcohol dehydrogenase, partial [Candidatus Marinimicrobia bacterium]|nr:iron-containing alcohol dehydrogenase [Candidatus Neomarinimicrobiota bacterium]
MKTIELKLGERSYNIHVESDLLKKIPEILTEQNHGQKWLIISQYNLMELFGFDLMMNLKEANFECDYITLPVGEAAKSMNEFSRIISQMIEMSCDRSTTILALGGGVVGDVAGFVASSFMR